MTLVDKPWLNASLTVDALFALLLGAMSLDAGAAKKKSANLSEV